MPAAPAVGNVAPVRARTPADEATMAFWSREEGSPNVRREDPTPDAGGTGDLLLGAGAEFEGKLTFAGTVRIDARFKGTIVTNDVLVVGDRARIDADITCGTVIVHGEVNGNIRAKDAVELHAPARVRGDVETPSFSLEKGVVFQGQTNMPAGEKGAGSADKGAGAKAARPAEARSGPVVAPLPAAHP
jgi:cytoskeletal protein CcmA (bactofilin family)